MQRSTKTSNLKVALVDDFLTTDGGAQRVLRIFHQMWPDAPVYAAVYFPEKFTPPLTGWDIRTSWVSRLPFQRALEQQYKLFYPAAVESYDLSEYDLVISSTYAGYAKGVMVSPNAVHLSYVHTVPRFLWGYRTSQHERVNWLYKNVILPPLEHYWRMWDRATSMRPDAIAVNSHNIARRVWKFYRRKSEVIHPPVDVGPLLSLQKKRGDYFIYFGRLEKYKCVDMAIRACAVTRKKLVIVGTGSEENSLKQLVVDLRATQFIEFVGWKISPEKDTLVSSARAFIFPGPDEDFGMVLVESLAAGTPVIAFDRGGAKEILNSPKYGHVISEFSQEALDRAVQTFDPDLYPENACRARAKEFSEEIFVDKMTRFVSKYT